MKKTLLIAVLALSSTAFSQVLESDNYDSYTMGNVSTATDGSVAGQGGMYLYAGATTDYQIADVGSGHGLALEIISGNTAANASNRYVYKDGFDTAWAGRTAGNNILVGTLELFTGFGDGASRIGSTIFSSTGGIVGVNYNSSTNQINGLAYLVSTATGTGGFYNITFGATAPTYADDTWIKIGYSYNSDTGVITYDLNGTAVTLNIAGYTTPTGLLPIEHDIMSSFISGNAATKTTFVDNYAVGASNTTVLGVKGGQIGSEFAAIYPNPATDVLNISYSKKVKDVEIYDMNGKKVQNKVSDNKVDIKNLTPGVYIININTGEEVQSQKFIKK